MITNENKFLIKILFSSIDCLIFFKEQLFDELKEIIPEDLCYSIDNKNQKIRNINKIKCEELIKNFFESNPIYKSEIEFLYKKQISEITEDVLGGYIFLLKKGINVLEDEKSACYVEGVNLLSIKK